MGVCVLHCSSFFLLFCLLATPPASRTIGRIVCTTKPIKTAHCIVVQPCGGQLQGAGTGRGQLHSFLWFSFRARVPASHYDGGAMRFAFDR